MGLAAGDLPAEDVTVLAEALACVEFDLARRMHAASRARALPLRGDGQHLMALAWSGPWALRLARTGSFAESWPEVGTVWATGVITSDHLDPLAKAEAVLTHAEMAATLAELAPLWGQVSPAAVEGFVKRLVAALHPGPDPTVPEWDAYAQRHLDVALTGDSVILSGSLPRLEGELVLNALNAVADRLRSTAAPVSARARRADALVELVSTAHAAGVLPSRGGLPVALTVTMATTDCGDLLATSSGGHGLTDSEIRFATCDAMVTPVLVSRPAVAGTAPATGSAHTAGTAHTGGTAHSAGTAPTSDDRVRERIAALARVLLEAPQPLAVGRTARTATPVQRRGLAARDGGCVIPGCQVPAEACQVHHVQPWADGGGTDPANLVLVCWAHHRQVELGSWTITPGRPGPRPGQRPGPDPDGPDPDGPHPDGPHPGTQTRTGWPASNGAPWTITATPRTRWRSTL